MSDFKKDILKKIKDGEIDMKPRWHFVLRSLLLILGIVTFVLLGIYILSFVFFFMQQSGVGFMPLYGFHGIIMFVVNSPWLLIVFAGSALVILQLLVHKYSFSYRQPMVYTVIGVIVLVLLGSYAIEKTLLHQRLQGFVEQNKIPVFGSLYRGIDDHRPKNIVIGTIEEINEGDLTIESEKDGMVQVFILDETSRHPGVLFEIGNNILVFGKREGSVIEAIGIRPAPKDFDDFGFGPKLPKDTTIDEIIKDERGIISDSVPLELIYKEGADACLTSEAGEKCESVGVRGEIFYGECQKLINDMVCLPLVEENFLRLKREGGVEEVVE